jgi:hypothetical protein
MRKIYFKYHTGFCGMSSAEVEEFPDNVTEDELNEYAWLGALANAETYGIYPTDYDQEEDEEDDGDNYSDNIEGYWEDYNAEKHEGTY